jgi:LCP family protein required for cell wall assembly
MTRPWRWDGAAVRRTLVLAVVLATTLLVVPQASLRLAPMTLVKVDTAFGVAHSPNVIWILCLGSDARPGQALVGQRADAIQMVAVNLRTGTVADIGVPRDSWVDIPGHGMNKINASMYYGGPQLMAQSVGNLIGVHPDYVFTAGFDGFRALIRAIGGVTVYSRFAFSDPVRPQGYHVGWNRLNAFQTLIFARVRHPLPRGDFDRSADQQAVLRAILRKVHARESQPGFMERGLLAVVHNLNTDLKPSELFTLAQAVTAVKLSRFRSCVVQGGVGYVGLQSVVFPDVAQARRLGNDARDDAKLNGPC